MAHGRKTGGRQKGTQNKVTSELREMILNALSAAGGEKYLLLQAKATPSAFLTLVGKILPSEIKAQHSSGLNGGEIPMGNTELANRILFLLTTLEERAKAVLTDGKPADS